MLAHRDIDRAFLPAQPGARAEVADAGAVGGRAPVAKRSKHFVQPGNHLAVVGAAAHFKAARAQHADGEQAADDSGDHEEGHRGGRIDQVQGHYQQWQPGQQRERPRQRLAPGVDALQEPRAFPDALDFRKCHAVHAALPWLPATVRLHADQENWCNIQPTISRIVINLIIVTSAQWLTFDCAQTRIR